MFHIKGTISEIKPTEKKSDKFSVREFHLSTAGKHPQTLSFQLLQDRCDILDSFATGDMVTVYFALLGREWQGRVFNTLSAFKIENDYGNSATTTATASSKYEAHEEEEDLPF